jgi:hypothetical protein
LRPIIGVKRRQSDQSQPAEERHLAKGAGVPDSVLAHGAQPSATPFRGTTNPGSANPTPHARWRRRGSASLAQCHICLETSQAPRSHASELTKERSGRQRASAAQAGQTDLILSKMAPSRFGGQRSGAVGVIGSGGPGRHRQKCFWTAVTRGARHRFRRHGRLPSRRGRVVGQTAAWRCASRRSLPPSKFSAFQETQAISLAGTLHGSDLFGFVNSPWMSGGDVFLC